MSVLGRASVVAISFGALVATFGGIIFTYSEMGMLGRVLVVAIFFGTLAATFGGIISTYINGGSPNGLLVASLGVLISATLRGGALFFYVITMIRIFTCPFGRSIVSTSPIVPPINPSTTGE